MVASDSHYGAKKIDWAAQREKTKSVSGFPEYEVSKLGERPVRAGARAPRAAPPHVRGAPRRRRDRCVAPRAAAVPLDPEAFLLTPEQGAVSMLRAASDPAIASDTGNYYDQTARKNVPAAWRRPSLLANCGSARRSGSGYHLSMT